MKRFAAGMTGSLLFLCLVVGSAAAQDKTYSGESMDSNCAKDGSHAVMLRKRHGSMDPNETKAKELYADNCVRKMGARCVLYIPSKAVYRLDDQTKPEQFAEQKVRVTGTLDAATKTIHVTDMNAGS